MVGRWCVYIDGEYVTRFATQEEAEKYIGGHAPRYEVKQEFPTEYDELSEDEQTFKEITEQMLQTYIKKNRDYGGAFERGMERDGVISAITRMYDKLDRLHSLKDKNPEIVEESVQDTLLDLANYAIMTHICLQKKGTKRGTAI